jgi:hypothetical protein
MTSLHKGEKFMENVDLIIEQLEEVIAPGLGLGD